MLFFVSVLNFGFTGKYGYNDIILIWWYCAIDVSSCHCQKKERVTSWNSGRQGQLKLNGCANEQYSGVFIVTGICLARNTYAVAADVPIVMSVTSRTISIRSRWSSALVVQPEVALMAVAWLRHPPDKAWATTATL